MALPSAKAGFSATPPTFAVKGAHNSLLLEMPGLGLNPASGRLLRGLTPFLDDQGASHVFLLTQRRRREPWSAEPEQVVSYQELLHWKRGPDGGTYRGVTTKEAPLTHDEVIQAFQYEPLDLIDWAARRMGTAVISNRSPLVLKSCDIPKPWGREIWYTGIESRGVSRVITPTGDTELPYALGMFPVPVIGEKEAPPLLLKILDPLPDPVYGDLYLEVHREKWETYVVLSVDPTAWPDGSGTLRAGLDPEAVKKAREKHPQGWEAQLADDLKKRIGEYERVRREIDAHLDQALRNQGEDPDQPIRPELHRELLEALPKSLCAGEAEKRTAVESLVGSVPLRPGDVVTLPPGVLHSLRHGVKVIEFQTPTYERLIAMFAQKVLTQPHWDVDEAVNLMDRSPYQPPALEVLQDADDVRVERVVDFPQFQVDRTRLDLNRTRQCGTEGDNRYQLLFATAGKGELLLPNGDTFPMEPETAYLLPATLGKYAVNAISAQGLTYLEASPTLEVSDEPVEVEVSVDEILERTW